MLYPYISKVPEDIKRLSGRQKAAALSAIARECAGQSARRSNFRIERFEKDAQGRPVPLDGVFWSISHKSDIVAGIVSDRNVGIDIEIVREVRSGLFRKLVDTDEEKLFPSWGESEIFFRAFTAKEAVLKLLGLGIKGLSKVKIKAVADDTNMMLVYQNDKYWVENFRFDGYLASVTKNQMDVQWTIL